jgi:hypothetical protein
MGPKGGVAVLPERVRSRRQGRGFLGDITFYSQSTGEITGEVISQTGEKAYATATSSADVAGNHFGPFGAEVDHELVLERLEGEFLPTISGTIQDPDVRTEIVGWVTDDYRTLSDILLDPLLAEQDPLDDLSFRERLEIPWPAVLEHADITTQLIPVNSLLARTNPGRPETDVPSFLWEGLRDAPSLVLNRGRTVAGAAGSANLQWQFGWKPLLSDLKNLIEFGDKTSKRLARLQRLVKGMLKTGAYIDRVSQQPTTEQVNFAVDDTPFAGMGPVLVDVTKATEIKRWGTVSYVLKPEAAAAFQRYVSEEPQWASINATYGLYWRNPAALWEVLPWSWLVDWFVPIQDLLEQYQGLVPVEAVAVCVMTQSTTTVTFGQTYHDELVVRPTTLKRITKERRVLAPDGSLPYIEGAGPMIDLRRLGILVSIWAQRR